MTPPIIAVLGPRGTNTERVAMIYWKGQRVRFKRVSNLPSIFERVRKKEVTHGVIPVEDSVEGDVTLSLDLLRKYDLYITGELCFPVTHYLLAKKSKKSIKTIASHPQALAHCKKYLERFFSGIKQIQTLSTAEAARLASIHPTIGAIASKWVANIYGLKVIDEDIHDRGSNTTRFLIIQEKPANPKGSVKTSVIIDIPEDRPGILHQILGEFARRAINLTKIMSRPSRGILGEYVFFIDFEGKEKDPKVKEVYQAIEKEADIKSLGSYPSPIDIPSEMEKVESQVTMEDLRLAEPSFKFWENAEDQVYDSY